VRSTLIVSLVLGTVGTVAFGAAMSATGSYLVLLPGLIVLSIGQGITFTVMFAAASTGAQAQDQGIVSGIASTGQQVGGAVGLALLVAIANATTADTGLTGHALRVATTDGLRRAVYVAAAGIAATLLAAIGFARSRRGTPVSAGSAPRTGHEPRAGSEPQAGHEPQIVPRREPVREAAARVSTREVLSERAPVVAGR
jgi:MFS family permease